MEQNRIIAEEFRIKYILLKYLLLDNKCDTHNCNPTYLYFYDSSNCKSNVSWLIQPY